MRLASYYNGRRVLLKVHWISRKCTLMLAWESDLASDEDVLALRLMDAQHGSRLSISA